MTRELADMLRRSRTIDWQQKESARAGMRYMVKKLLKKYKYPPEGMEDAIATVIGQCEMWTDYIDYSFPNLDIEVEPSTFNYHS
jgi:type I restriction enzyme, R subunit